MAAQGRRLSPEVRRLILQYAAKKLTTGKIQKVLEREHLVITTRQAVRNFLVRFQKTGTIRNVRGGKKNASKLTNFHKQLINMWLSHNSELTARMIRDKLLKFFGLKVSISLVCKARRELGWTTCRVKYCQLISHKNKKKRLEWCLSAMATKDSFEDVVFTDETTVEMCANGKLFFHKRNSSLQKIPAKKQKPKHSYKVHVWAGISYHGRTDISVFTGVMDSVSYQKILKRNFIPFVKKRFPGGYRLYQDNDSKHKSKSTVAWMTDVGMIESVMECPASSPDINPIENVWASMKQFLENTIKPKKKEELVKGIKLFWEQLTAEQCGRYIDHIHRVLPMVVLNEGGPSGF